MSEVTIIDSYITTSTLSGERHLTTYYLVSYNQRTMISYGTLHVVSEVTNLASEFPEEFGMTLHCLKPESI
jgi:hypothetical protein